MDWQARVHHKRVIVGISGGVDSSVAAYLLKAAGADVHGVFMKNWEESYETGYCTSAQDLEDAQSIANTLNIPLHTVNFAKDYKERVFSYFIDTLKAGLTPNPDVLCNKEIKFKAFLDYAVTLGADFIATGHYAQTRQIDGLTYLTKGIDTTKDQSYFLHLLNQAQLNKTIFPIGHLKKTQVREYAEQQRLITFDKKDSTGICFIGERDFNQFISQYISNQSGEMVTPEGEVIGQHQGLSFYTIGQRQGLGIGGRKNSAGTPWFVAEKDQEHNRLIVVQGEHDALYGTALIAQYCHWITTPIVQPTIVTAKIRYRQQDQDCTVIPQDNGDILVHFTERQRAITPGQSVVFYQNDLCLGGAIIRHKYQK